MTRDLKTPLSESNFDKSKDGSKKVKSYTAGGKKVCYVTSSRGSIQKVPCKK